MLFLLTSCYKSHPCEGIEQGILLRNPSCLELMLAVAVASNEKDVHDYLDQYFSSNSHRSSPNCQCYS